MHGSLQEGRMMHHHLGGAAGSAELAAIDEAVQDIVLRGPGCTCLVVLKKKEKKVLGRKQAVLFNIWE